jgi:hypothetical protein
VAIELDHLMWGAPTLEEGMAEAERLFGVAAAPGGVHLGVGTQNALISLGERHYLEIIAPDPQQELAGTFGEKLAGLAGCGLITWAAAAPTLAALAERAEALEITARGPSATQRRTPDGDLLKWELLFLGGHRYPGLVPFFIDWLETPHPATTNPVAGQYRGLVIRTPDAAALNEIFAGLGIAMRAEEADAADLTAIIETASGEVRLGKAPGTDGWTL